MTNILKKYWKKLVIYFSSDPDEQIEDEEFNKFLEKMQKRMKKVHNDPDEEVHPKEISEITLKFENAYMQRKMTETNESVKTATWVMALAALGTLIGTFYGVENLNKTLEFALQFAALLIIIVLASYLLKGIWKIIKLIIKRVNKK